MNPIRERFKPGIILALTWMAAQSMAMGAEGADDRWGFMLGAGRLFNLVLVVAVLVWAARKPLSNFYRSRSETIRDQLEEAQTARREAEAKLAEIESRMSRLDEEMREIKTAAEKEAEEERARLTVQAEHDAEKVVERARQEIEGMTRSAQVELKKHAADLSVQLAEARIRTEIGDEDRRRLLSSFLAKLGERP